MGFDRLSHQPQEIRYRLAVPTILNAMAIHIRRVPETTLPAHSALQTV